MGVVLRQVAGNASEVVDAAARLHRPLDHVPLEQIVGHEVAVLVGAGAVEIPDLVAIVDGQGAGDGLPLMEGHIQAALVAQIVQHGGKILRRTGGKIVADAGLHHDAGKIRHHFLAAEPDLHALFHRQTDIIAPFLMERGHEFFLVSAVQIEAEYVFRLDGLKILSRVAGAEAEVRQQFGKFRVAGGHVRVDLDDIGLFLLRKSPGRRHQLAEGGAVVQIADGATAGVHHLFAHHGHFPDQKGDTALDFSRLVAADDGLPLPGRLLLCPEDALGKMALGVALDKGFIFGQVRFVDIFRHGCISKHSFSFSILPQFPV